MPLITQPSAVAEWLENANYVATIVTLTFGAIGWGAIDRWRRRRNDKTRDDLSVQSTALSVAEQVQKVANEAVTQATTAASAQVTLLQRQVESLRQEVADVKLRHTVEREQALRALRDTESALRRAHSDHEETLALCTDVIEHLDSVVAFVTPLMPTGQVLPAEPSALAELRHRAPLEPELDGE